jgi:hypothetical protein
VRVKIVIGLNCGIVAVASSPGARAASGDHVWSKRFGRSGFDVVYGMASDPSDGVFITGVAGSPSIDLGGGSSQHRNWVACQVLSTVLVAASTYSSSIDMGGGPLGNGLPVIGRNSDLVLAKYSPSGAYLWAKRLGGPGVESASGVVSNPAGDVFLTAYTDGWMIDLGDGALASHGDVDLLIAKYQGSG